MRKFVVDRDYNDMGCNIFKKKTITINEGVTVLVGCNGMGKTTLIKQIIQKLEKDDIPVVSFDNLKDGGSRAREKFAFYGDITSLATSFFSSEGENIYLNIGKFASRIARFAKDNTEANASEMWIFFDAIDSGLSVDNIVEVKEQLFNTIIKTNPNITTYIVVSANEYELARNANCFDVYNGEYIQFKNYEEYRDFILNSRKTKDSRVYKDR